MEQTIIYKDDHTGKSFIEVNGKFYQVKKIASDHLSETWQFENGECLNVEMGENSKKIEESSISVEELEVLRDHTQEYYKAHREYRISTLYDGSTGEKHLMETFLSMRGSGELGKEEIKKIEDTYKKTGNPCLGVIVKYMEKEKNAEKEELL